MARLRIERNSTDLSSSNRRVEIEGYDGVLPDETISSWAKRHPFVRLVSDDPDERDFGELEIDLPGAQQSLLFELTRAAAAPDAWLLQPHLRTLYCVKCLAEDRVLGLPFFVRRAWSVAWRTCCRRHGMLFDSYQSNVPRWHSRLFDPKLIRQKISITVARRIAAVLELDLCRSQRAIHLESALAGEKVEGAWFPVGLDTSSIRDVYRALVTDLVLQFGLVREGVHDKSPDEDFNCQPNSNRFAINVLAEAILSERTNTPLPKSALAQNSDLLVRAIGWGTAVPATRRRGQVFFRGPLVRWRLSTHFEALLGSTGIQNPSNPISDNNYSYFTLPEAWRLGLNIDRALNWLTELTRKGQFLAFDAKNGCLTENTMLPEKFRLEPADAYDYDLLLPAWAFVPPEPPLVQDLKVSMPSDLWSPEWETYLKFRRRITRKRLLRGVHFEGRIGQ